MSDRTHKSRAAQMRKRRVTGAFSSVQTNGTSTTRVVPRQQQQGIGTNTTLSPPDLNRRTDMWTDTDSLSDSDDESMDMTSPTITSPSRPPSGGVPPVQPTITTTTTTTTTPTRDSDVAQLRAFLDQNQGQPQSTEMEAALRQMQEAVDAHRSGTLTDNALQRALSTVRIVEVTGAPTVPLTVAQPPAPRFGLTLDGVRITELSQDQLLQLIRERRGNLPDKAALGYILANGQFSGSMNDLASLLDQVEQRISRLWSGAQLDDTEASRLARMVKDDALEQQQLQATFGTEITGVSGPQCREMRNFTSRFPNYLNNLKKYVKGYAFGSRKAIGQGAGVFESATGLVHMAAMGDKAPEAFVRLFVHETGHASLQRELVGGKPPGPLEKGTYPAQHQRRADLYAALDAQQQIAAKQGLRRQKFAGGKIDTATTTMLQDLDNLEKTLKDADVVWQAMSPDAKTFYQAWQKLRGQDGMHMIGIDMGRASNKQMMRSADRQKYQADDFTEFCAESFMHLAWGDLDAHVAVMQTRNDVPNDVKQAWANVQTIMHKYGDPILG